MVEKSYASRALQGVHAFRVGLQSVMPCVSDHSLPDYLTYHATTSTARSTCSLACKCAYVPPGTTITVKCDSNRQEISTDGWSARFMEKIGTSIFQCRS